MYHSTIPQRTQPLTADDFPVRGACRFSEQTVDNFHQNIEAWNRCLSISPARLLSLFRHVTEATLKVDLLAMEEDTFELSLHDSDAHLGGVHFMLELPENNADKDMPSSTISIASAAQGNGLGRRISLARVELCAALGIRALNLQACMEYGGYSWAALGYEPDMRASSLRHLSQTIKARLAALEGCLPKKLHEDMMGLADLTQADDLLHIAQCRYNLDGKIFTDEFDADSGRSFLMEQYVSHTEEAYGLNVGNIAASLKRYVAEAALSKRDITLGKFLLTRTTWPVRLDLQDDRQMAKLAKLSGPFHTLQWSPEEPAVKTDVAPHRFQLAL